MTSVSGADEARFSFPKMSGRDSRRRSQLLQSGKLGESDGMPIVIWDAAATAPELRTFDQDGLAGPDGLGEGLISPGVRNNGGVGPHGMKVHNAPSAVKHDLHPTGEYLDRMNEPHERLAHARRAAGFSSATEAAQRLGVTKETYVQHERGIRGFTKRAEDYGRAFGVDPAWLLFGRGESPHADTGTGRGGKTHGVRPSGSAALTKITRYVPVLGEVRAGAWTDIPEDQLEAEEMLPIHLPGFEHAQLYALRVEGRSMDKEYKDGSRVVVCPVAEIGIRQGDHVIVRRRRNGLMETTLKEVVQDRTGISLWPRSTDAAHQTPIRLDHERDPDDGVEIVGVVVAAYSVRPQQSRPLIQI